MEDSSKQNDPGKDPKSKKRTELDQKKGTLSTPRPARPPRPPKIPPARFYGKFTDLMNQVEDLLSGALKFPPFPQRFMVYKPGPGGDLILEVGDKQIVTVVEKAHVVKAIVKYTRENMLCNDSFTWTHRQCSECFDFWASATYEHKEEIPAFRWKDEPGLTFHRLPWEKPKAPYDLSLNNAPVFKEFMDRISNNKALMIWIGSLFDLSSTRHQYVWLKGEGGDGKGSLLEFLQRIFLNTFSMEEVPANSGQRRFWSLGLIGKRVVAFDECKEPKFVMDPLFKRVTGNKSIKTETKNGSADTENLVCKCIFTSQQKPLFSNEKANIRRNIYCNVDPIHVPPDMHYGDKLDAEGFHFLSACIGRYQQWRHDSPNAAEIPSEQSEVVEIINSYQEDFEVFFANNFVKRQGNIVNNEKVFPILQRHFGSNDKKIGEFKQYLTKTHGILYRRSSRDNGKRGTEYENLAIKQWTGVGQG